MSAEEQLVYVEKYYTPFTGKLHSVEDLYLATFYPRALGEPDSFIIGSEKSDRYASLVASQNPAIARFSKTGHKISVGAFRSYVQKKYA